MAMYIAVACSAIVALTGCGELPTVSVVRADGSSTVSPILSAAAEMFRLEQDKIDVSVGTSGTGNGFRKFLEEYAQMRTDIAMASRPIHAQEAALAAERGIAFIELPVAYDGIVVTVNASNDFCGHLTVSELRRIFGKEERIDNWNQVRPGFPSTPLRRYGPGFEDGTFEFFADAVVGGARNFRSDDYEASEYDDLLVQAVARDRGGIAFFGYGYYTEYRQQLRAVGITVGDAPPVFPSVETIADGTYKPLTRPLFIYVNADSYEREDVAAFLRYFFHDPARFVEHPYVGFVSLSPDLYQVAQQRLAQRRTGTVYALKESREKPLRDLYQRMESEDSQHAQPTSPRN